jgi:hypothetical protein
MGSFCSMTLPLRLGMALLRWLIGFAWGDELAEFDPAWNHANYQFDRSPRSQE